MNVNLSLIDVSVFLFIMSFISANFFKDIPSNQTINMNVKIPNGM